MQVGKRLGDAYRSAGAGMDVVQEISKAKVNPKDERPYEDIKIINIVVK